MSTEQNEPVLDADDTDWRLHVKLPKAPGDEELKRLSAALHGSDPATPEPDDGIAVTHDGATLFAYAPSRAVLDAARTRLESALAAESLQADVQLDHWNEAAAMWAQLDASGAESAQARDRERERAQVVTHTYVCNAGRFVRGQIEQSMLALAERLGLRCEVVAHPHLLTTQLAFTVTGPLAEVEDFRAALDEEAKVSIRADAFGTGLTS